MIHVTPLFPALAQRHTSFDDFWVVYPRKVSKGFARTAWQRACRKADPATIIDAALQYSKTAIAPYIKHPATWLNGECWADETTESPMTNYDGRSVLVAKQREAAERGSQQAKDWLKNNT